jgi:protein disulfide-isomerase A1
MIRQTLPLISTVMKGNIEELLSLDMPLVIAYVDENDQKSPELLNSIADSYHDKFLFGISSDTSLAKAETVKPPFLVLHSALDHIYRVFDKTFDISKIEEFLNELSAPLIGKFSLQTFHAYTQVSPLEKSLDEKHAE